MTRDPERETPRQRWRRLNRPRLWSAEQRAVLATLGLVVCGGAAVLLWRSPAHIPDPQPPAGDRAGELDNRLDANTATAGELAALPGIGPSRAEAIVAFRARGHTFRSAADLERVPGIGPVLAGQMKPFLRFPDDRPPP